MHDSTGNDHFRGPHFLQGKQRIKAAAHQLPKAIHDDRQETVNNLNQQIQHGQPSSSTSAAENSGISSFSWMHETLYESSSLFDTIQDAATPTSNRNSMPAEMESSGGDYYTDNTMLIEYPLRHSPECVLLRPVCGANTHPDYVWKK